MSTSGMVSTTLLRLLIAYGWWVRLTSRSVVDLPPRLTARLTTWGAE